MIMPRGEPLLMPVNPVFMWFSLVAGLAINMLPLGRIVWTPDLLMVLLVFWGVHQPLRIGMGAAFVLGLCMDVSQSALLGQHALSYTVLSFGAIAIHRRLLWFSVPSQALQVFPLFALAHAIEPAWRALREWEPEQGDTQPELDEPPPHGHTLLAWRQQGETRWRSLPPLEATLLQAVAEGAPFAALCERAALALDDADAAAPARSSRPGPMTMS